MPSSSSSSIKEIDEQTTIVFNDPEEIMKSALHLFSELKNELMFVLIIKPFFTLYYKTIMECY